MRYMNLYLSEMEISKELQFKIQKYIDFMYEERHQYMLEGYSLLDTLSENLKSEIKFRAHSRMLVT